MKENKFKELLMKKKAQGCMLDDESKSAKMEVIQQLMEAMGNDMGEKVKGLQKVTVAAPDKEGLEEGLEKAQEVVSEADEVMAEDGQEEIESEDEEESVEALKAKIAKLESQISEGPEA